MQTKSFIAAALAAGSAVAQQNMSLTDALSSNNNLSSLAKLLQGMPDFAAALANMTNVTIFAPNNQALSSLIQSNSSSSSNSSSTNLSDAVLNATLSYHVLTQEYTSDNFTFQPLFVPTLLEDSDYTQVTGGQVVELRALEGDAVVISGLGNTANVVTADVMYDNGIIHVIDSLLTIPPSVQDLVGSRLPVLFQALSDADLLDTVSTTPDLTVFAPNNSAFMAIGSALNSLDSTTGLADILQYHVTNQSVFYSTTLTGNDTITMLDMIDADVVITDDGAICINQACVTIADVLVSNGVCHIINSVLNPNNTDVMPSTDGTPAVAFDNASSAPITLPTATAMPTTTFTSVGTELTAVDTAPASDYTVTPTSAGQNPAANTPTSDPAGHNTVPTAAVGAAALFGIGAFAVGW